MKVMTVKLNPKTVFGLILVAAGVLVVLLTFWPIMSRPETRHPLRQSLQD